MEPWVKKALELKQSGISWTQLPKTLTEIYNKPFTYDQVRNKIRRSDFYHKGKITYTDKKASQDVTSLVNKLIEIQHSLSELDDKQTETHLSVDDDKPVGIAFWGDWHVGSRGVDHEQLFRDLETIKQTDGLYCIGMGDYIENYTGAIKGSVHEQILAPHEQIKVVQHIMTEVGNKMLVLVRGCHEDFAFKDSNTDIAREFAKTADTVYLWHGGDIYLTIGEELYHIRARHKYKSESSVNTTNAQRMMMVDKGPCDIGFVAHKHFCEIQHTKKMGQDVVWGRSGTYKILDEYGQKLAGYEGMYGVPILILYPHEKRIVPFKDFESGLEHLNYARQN